MTVAGKAIVNQIFKLMVHSYVGCWSKVIAVQAGESVRLKEIRTIQNNSIVSPINSIAVFSVLEIYYYHVILTCPSRVVTHILASFLVFHVA